MPALLDHCITRSTVYSLMAVVLVAFLESLALVGLILPGTVLMAGLGALIGSGDRNRVLIAEGNGHFTPVEVVAGRAQDGWVEIKRGLNAGQQVVTSGQFLIDSEASMRSALPQMAAETEVKQYQAEGVIKALNGDSMTLLHGPVPELQWPAMTMDFALPPGGLPAGIKPGDRVKIRFSVDDSGSHISQVLSASAEHGGHL